MAPGAGWRSSPVEWVDLALLYILSTRGPH